jgi:hypothetical protein
MAAIKAGTLRNVPRRRRLRVISAKKRSTRFSQEAPVGVKRKMKPGCSASHVVTVGCLCVP